MAIDDQALRDALRAIEAGEIPEDLDLPDPEEYDDMGGIKSLDRGAPSIKMASETPEEEAELMLMMEEFQKQQELKKQLEKEKEEGKMASGYKLNDFELNRGVYESMGIKLYNLIDDPEAGSFQEHEVREMIYGGQYASGGRVKYGDGTDKNKYNFMDLIDTKAEDEYYKTKEELLDRKYNAKNYPPSQRNMSMEELKKMLKKAEEDKVKRAKGGIAGVL